MEQPELPALDVWHPVTPTQRSYLIYKSILELFFLCLFLTLVGALIFGGYFSFADNFHDKLSPESFKHILYGIFGFIAIICLLNLPIFWFIEIPRMQWKLTTSQLSIRDGSWFQTESVFPLCRSQTYQTSQTLISKRFGITEITILASGSSQVSLDYLTSPQIKLITQALDAAIQRDFAKNSLLQSGLDQIEK